MADSARSRLASSLTRLPVSPNQVTLVSICFGIAACVMALRPGRLAMALAGALIIVQVILDSCDGELARVRHMGSKLGMWLDNLSDDLIDNGFVLAVGFGVGGPWRWVALAAVIGKGFCALVTYHGAAKVGAPGDVMAFRWWFESKVTMAEVSTLFAHKTDALTIVRAVGRRDVYVLIYGAACAAQVPWVTIGRGRRCGRAEGQDDGAQASLTRAAGSGSLVSTARRTRTRARATFSSASTRWRESPPRRAPTVAALSPPRSATSRAHDSPGPSRR